MFRVRHPEKILLVLSVAALLGAVGWAQYNPTQSKDMKAGPPIAAARYVPAAPTPREAEPPGWNRPPSQQRGDEWVYEMFTPPEIFYDPRSREFSVKPPATLTPETETTPVPVIAPPEPFRLQLVGFVGGEGSYLGTFENLTTTEYILARGGRALPDLGVTIRDFQVKRVRREPEDSMATSELMATAIVRDERTGEDVVLTNLERAYVRPRVSP
jgi:hypothetical protein